MLPRNVWCVAVVATVHFACASVSAPPSRMPDAQTAVARLDATYASVSGVSGSAKIDYLGDRGRVRGDVSVLASAPASLRFAVTADVVGAAGELASDGVRFEADDKGNGRYVVGLAKPCNIARITQVPLPSNELVPMLWGARPHIDGPIVCDSLTWSGEGFYVAMLRGEDRAAGLAHELHIAPFVADWGKPYAVQRMKLVGVLGWSGGELLYRVTMTHHEATRTARALVDPDGLEPEILPSGPDVEVAVPRLVHVEVPGRHSDVIFRYTDAALNPPLIPNAFQLQMRPGVRVDRAECN